MGTISVGELRQNPTSALAAVEGGETYIVTRYRRPVARLVPIARPAPRGADLTRLGERFKARHPGAAGFTQAWLDQSRAEASAPDPWCLDACAG
jgi:antitoxin (DNA-binding transcriptional repressor) of toxin-antitoxin stability system